MGTPMDVIEEVWQYSCKQGGPMQWFKKSGVIHSYEWFYNQYNQSFIGWDTTLPAKRGRGFKRA